MLEACGENLVSPLGGFSRDGTRLLMLLSNGELSTVYRSGLALLDPATGQPDPRWRGHEPWSMSGAEATELVLLSRALGLALPDRLEWPELFDLSPRPRTALDDPAQLDSPLPAASLSDLSDDELHLLEAIIPARRGVAPSSAGDRARIARMDWYRPDQEPSPLTRVDRENLVAVQKALKGR